MKAEFRKTDRWEVIISEDTQMWVYYTIYYTTSFTKAWSRLGRELSKRKIGELSITIKGGNN